MATYIVVKKYFLHKEIKVQKIKSKKGVLKYIIEA